MALIPKDGFQQEVLHGFCEESLNLFRAVFSDYSAFWEEFQSSMSSIDPHEIVRWLEQKAEQIYQQSADDSISTKEKNCEALLKLKFRIEAHLAGNPNSEHPLNLLGDLLQALSQTERLIRHHIEILRYGQPATLLAGSTERVMLAFLQSISRIDRQLSVITAKYQSSEQIFGLSHKMRQEQGARHVMLECILPDGARADSSAVQKLVQFLELAYEHCLRLSNLDDQGAAAFEWVLLQAGNPIRCTLQVPECSYDPFIGCLQRLCIRSFNTKECVDLVFKDMATQYNSKMPAPAALKSFVDELDAFKQGVILRVVDGNDLHAEEEFAAAQRFFVEMQEVAEAHKSTSKSKSSKKSSKKSNKKSGMEEVGAAVQSDQSEAAPQQEEQSESEAQRRLRMLADSHSLQ